MNEYLVRVEQDHVHILDAILARDPETAQAMVLQHLTRAKRMYTQYHKAALSNELSLSEMRISKQN